MNAIEIRFKQIILNKHLHLIKEFFKINKIINFVLN
jgi:hypothetical protein